MSRARPAAKERSLDKAEPAFDKYEHHAATQRAPESVAQLLDDVYRDARGGTESPRTLREDFCGTFATCCAWVGLDHERHAVGVDRDPEAMAYGRDRYLAKLEPSQQERVQILEEHPPNAVLPKADVIASLRFSIFAFKERAEFVTYLRNCHETLEPGGVLVLECFGGLAVRRSNVERRKFESFTYVLEQEGFDLLTHEATFQVHFHRKGEKKQLRVFTYHWRIWSVPELTDALLEAGFAAVRTYWEEGLPGDARDGKLVLAEPGERARNRWTGLVVGLR